MIVTTAQQGAGNLFDQGMRSWSPGLSEFQRAQLRSLEQGQGAQLQPYGALQQNSMVNQQRAAQGQPIVTGGGVTSNGMQAGGQQMQSPVQTSPLSGTVQPQPVGQATPLQSAPMPQPMQQPVQQMTQQGGMASGLQPATPQTGLIGAESALESGLNAGVRAVNQGLQQGRQDLMQAGSGANNTLDRYYDPGQRANRYQAALSGALGEHQQSAAMDRFQSSPGQQYLLDESERALRRNASATGGLGSANVLKALQQNAVGLAAQDFDNSFNRLGQVSDRGLAAGGQIAGNTMQTGSALAGLGQNAMGLNANMAYGTGQNLASGRTRAGEMIAGNIQDTQSNLANLMNQTGMNIANTTGQGGAQLAQLLAGAGRDDLASQQAYATLLANLATGSGAQVAGLPSLGQAQQTSGILDQVGNAASGLADLGSWWSGRGG